MTELEAGKNLNLVRQVDGKQKVTSLGIKRADLGDDPAEQERQARVLAIQAMERAAKGRPLTPTAGAAPEPREAITLGKLCDLYAAHGVHNLCETGQREWPRRVRRVLEVIGPDRDVRSLSKTDVDRFTAHRKKEGRKQGTIASDLDVLKIALNWATEHKRSDGTPLIDQNPLAGLKIKREPKPRRPVAGQERYESLRAAMEGFGAAFLMD